MTAQEKTTSTAPEATLEKAISLARGGDKTGAGQMLRRLVAEQPSNQAAWIWLSAIAPDHEEAMAALTQAKKINPAHETLPRAEQWLIHRFSTDVQTRKSPVKLNVPGQSETRPTTSTAGSNVMTQNRGRAWSSFNAVAFGLAVTVVVVGLLILFAGLVVEVTGVAAASSDRQAAQQLWMDVEDLMAQQQWAKAIQTLETLSELEPDNSEISARMAIVYYRQGIAYKSRGFIVDALDSFENARKNDQNLPGLSPEITLATAYIDGANYYQAGEWPDAISTLEIIWQQDRNYINVKDLLYSAYFNFALSQQAAGSVDVAVEALESARLLRPDLSEPRRLLAELEFARTPGTVAELPVDVNIENRLILVGVAEQKMWVFEDGKRVFDFVISTGEPGRDTAVGEFEILNKIDVAYASTWNLDMPYWMGIYWAGPLQNGIHALPIVKHTGYKLWDGYLGQRVSYGCVILGDTDAAALYEWTEVGTKVKIVPSLANWSPEAE
jgi:tetratricopeptide (TPR) repeat protein